MTNAVRRVCEIENILVIVHYPLKKSELRVQKKKKHQKEQNESVVRQKKATYPITGPFPSQNSRLKRPRYELVAVFVSAILGNVRRSWRTQKTSTSSAAGKGYTGIRIHLYPLGRDDSHGEMSCWMWSPWGETQPGVELQGAAALCALLLLSRVELRFFHVVEERVRSSSLFPRVKKQKIVKETPKSQASFSIFISNYVFLSFNTSLRL